MSKPLNLSKGDEVRFKNGSLLYYEKPHQEQGWGWFKETHGSTPTKKYLKNVMKINGKSVNEGIDITSELTRILQEEIDKAVEDQKQETLEFEKDPMEYIIQKYPSLEATLIDLMSSVYKDYLTGIYVVSPKPTTFKILLHNGRSFLLIYNPQAYQAKVSGKLYNLTNLKDEEYAIKAISNLLLQGLPAGSAGPGEEVSNDVDLKDKFVSDMTSEPDLSGVDTSSTEEPTPEETPEEPEEELKESEEPQVKKLTKFRIVR